MDNALAALTRENLIRWVLLLCIILCSIILVSIYSIKDYYVDYVLWKRYSSKFCSLEDVLEGTSLPYSPPSGEVKISWAIAQGVSVAGCALRGVPL